MAEKGIAIATETIVYIIIAVVVLTILLYFLTSQSNPTIERVKMEQRAATLCGQYVQYDSTCTRLENVRSNSEVTKIVNGKDGLLDVCKKLSKPYCGASNDQSCIQSCCVVCPTKPS